MKKLYLSLVISIFFWGCNSGDQPGTKSSSSQKTGSSNLEVSKSRALTRDAPRASDSINTREEVSKGLEVGKKPSSRQRQMMGKTIQKGEKARPFKTQTWDGKDIDLDSYKGKYIFLDFWASWCAPCRTEIPYVKKLAEKYKDSDKLAIIGISLDRNDVPMKDYISKNGMTWMNAYDGSSGKVASLYGVKSIPFTVLIDPEGNVIATMLRGAAMMKEIDGRLGS